MPWWLILTIILLGTIAWAFVSARQSALRGRTDEPQREAVRRLGEQVESGKVRILPIYPVEEEPRREIPRLDLDVDSLGWMQEELG